MEIVVVLGRILFGGFFVISGMGHFTKRKAMEPYARSQGVPSPEILVPFSGLLILVGGLSVLLGCYARLGAWLLVLFLLPTTLMMHRFWGVPDPMQAQNQQAHFMKNIALLGAALLVAYFGSGPFSIAE